MAQEKEQEKTEAPSQRRRSRGLGWLIALMVVLMGAVTATNVYLVMSSQSGASAAAPEPPPPEEPPELQDPVFLEIEPFTVNLQDGARGSRLLYVGLTLKLGDEASRAFLEGHRPQLRSRLLMLLSGKEAEAVRTPRGKEQLKSEILSLLGAPMAAGQPDLAVEDVLFTEFIVQ